MSFRPDPGDDLTIGDKTYRFAENPAAPGMAFGRSGRRGTVYQIIDENGESWALKVFLRRYSDPRLVEQAEGIREFASLPGLKACERVVLPSSRFLGLFRQDRDLDYAVLMPWIPGKMWMEVVLSGQLLTAEAALELARNLVHVLRVMEERGLAHSDISGPNLIITPGGRIELVDLEEIYLHDLTPPAYSPLGSPGYTHNSAPEGLWSAEADRFAGALLLGEMLGWCEHKVVDAAWGESFFDPEEVQSNCERFKLLQGVLERHWGSPIGEAWEQAWFSDTVSACPRFSDWEAVLPDVVPDDLAARDSLHLPSRVAEETAFLIRRAQRASAERGLQRALCLLQHAVTQSEGRVAREIGDAIAELEEVIRLKDAIAGQEYWTCENCGGLVDQGNKVCPCSEAEPASDDAQASTRDRGMLDDGVPAAEDEAKAPRERDSSVEEVASLILRAKSAETGGDLVKALSFLKRAERDARGKLLDEIQERIARLRGEQ